MAVQIWKDFDRHDLYVGDQNCFVRVCFRYEHPLVSVSLGGSRYGQDPPGMADNNVRRHFSDDGGIFDTVIWKKPGQDHEPHVDLQIIGWFILLDDGWRHVDVAVAGVVQHGCRG